MKPDDLDRALSEDIRPSDAFAARVMVAVRQQAEAPPPLPFPWKRCIAGLAGCAAPTIVAVALVLVAGPERWVTPRWMEQASVVATSTATIWTAASLLISLVAARGSLRLAGYRS